MNASRQSFIVSAVLCTLMAALFVARYRLTPYPVEAPFEEGMPLAAVLTRFTVAHPWWAAVAAAVVVAWTLLLVVQLGIKYGLPASRNYLSAQIFLIGAGGLVIAGEALAALVAAWLMTLAARQFVFSLHKGYSFREVFHAGFYLGMIPLLYAPAVVAVVPVAIAGLTIYRRSGREAVVCFAGLALPVPAAGFIYWAAGTGGGFVYHELWRCALERQPAAWLPLVPVVGVAVLAVGLALTGVAWALGHKKNIRKTQFKFVQHTSFVLLAVAASGVLGGTSATLAALGAVPVALSVPYAFAGKQAGVATAIYCAVVIAVLVLDILPFFGIFLA